jgi:sugar O-acyltransferase (sialic acid O-acetyltransferase NeuD family)
MSDLTPIVIVGAGGLGREVYQWAQDCIAAGAAWQIRGFVDDDSSAMEKFNYEKDDAKILGAPDDYPAQADDHLLIALGDVRQRKTMAERLKGAQFATLVHPSANVAATARLGQGTLVCPFALVGPDAQVGEQVVLNFYASVAHDAQVGDFSVLCPYATVNGNAQLDSGVFVGTHATVTPGRRVGSDSKVNANTAVMRDVDRGSYVVGVPGRALPLYSKAR